MGSRVENEFQEGKLEEDNQERTGSCDRAEVMGEKGRSGSLDSRGVAKFSPRERHKHCFPLFFLPLLPLFLIFPLPPFFPILFLLPFLPLRDHQKN